MAVKISDSSVCNYVRMNFKLKSSRHDLSFCVSIHTCYRAFVKRTTIVHAQALRQLDTYDRGELADKTRPPLMYLTTSDGTCARDGLNFLDVQGQ